MNLFHIVYTFLIIEKLLFFYKTHSRCFFISCVHAKRCDKLGACTALQHGHPPL